MHARPHPDRARDRPPRVRAARRSRRSSTSTSTAAAAAGLLEVRLVHGRGRGVQRGIVQAALERHPRVVEFWDDPARTSARPSRGSLRSVTAGHKVSASAACACASRAGTGLKSHRLAGYGTCLSRRRGQPKRPSHSRPIDQAAESGSGRVGRVRSRTSGPRRRGAQAEQRPRQQTRAAGPAGAAQALVTANPIGGRRCR